jgi:peptidoglycan-associated lipoprotein
VEVRPLIAEPVSTAREPKDEDSAIRVVNGELQDAFFAYDHAEVNPEAIAALRHDAELLRVILSDFPALRIVIEGHCDDRGSAEYNVALGDRRAERAAAVLQDFHLAGDALQRISFGKEAPQCSEETEECRQKNRRTHLVVKKAPEL